MAPFIRKDNLATTRCARPSRNWSTTSTCRRAGARQTPFTNLTFDWTCPDDLKEQIPIIGGEEMPFTYGDLQVEMDMINRAYIEVMTAGDAKGRAFTFPIPTYNITPDFPWDSENADRLFDMTAKYGLPYFQNFVNSELKPNMVRSMCCRLQLDLRELLKRGNGLFGSAEQTGSLGVVTINCARLGYLHKGDETALLARLDALLEMGRDSLEIKRKVIQGLMDQGLFPYTKRYLGTLRNHFSTLGVNGINEMIRNFSDDAHDLTSGWGHAFACRLLDHVRARMVEFQEATGHLYNLEATPAEGTTYRFAKEDRKRWPDILQAGTTGAALLQQLLATAGGLYRRSVRGALAPGGLAGEIHRRHRAAPVHERTHLQRRGLQDPGQAGADQFPPALHHHHADLLDLPDARLSLRRAQVLPEVRRRNPGQETPTQGRLKTPQTKETP
jgi:anaerobic ribonucleoside-triphosphate reductase